MRRAALAIALALLLVGCSPAERTVTPVANTIRIVTIGDSNTDAATATTWIPAVTAMWPSLLIPKLQARYPSTTFTLVNTAYGGRTIRDIDDALSADCLTRSPDIVMLMAGTNDPDGEPHATGYQAAYSLGQTEASLRNIIERVQAVSIAPHAGNTTGHPVFVLMQPPPAQRKNGTSFPPNNYWRAYDNTEDADNSIPQVKALCTSLAAEYGVAIVPVFDNIAATGFNGSTNTSSTRIIDGIHLSYTGQQAAATWADAVLAAEVFDSAGAIKVPVANNYSYDLFVDPLEIAVANYDLWARPLTLQPAASGNYDLFADPLEELLVPKAPHELSSIPRAVATGVGVGAAIMSPERWSASQIGAYWPD